MSKLDSPVKRWPGSVTLPDYLTWPQVKAWTAAEAEADRLIAEARAAGRVKQLGEREVLTAADTANVRMAWLPGVCAIVGDWRLSGLDAVTPETFPATPPRSAAKLLTWLIDSISRLFDEEEDAPNE